MSDLVEKLARTDEAITIVRFLRRYTHQHALAFMIEGGIHRLSDTVIREYAAKNGILLRGPSE